jgi:uracil-DNA glycosylase family 4
LTNSNEQLEELRALVEAFQETAIYAGELGIELVEPPANDRALAAEPQLPPRAPAGAINPLTRNAEAAEFKTSPGRFQTAAGMKHESPEQGEKSKTMVKPTGMNPQEQRPPSPEETLFGIVTPADEASLPKPGETLEDVWADIGACTRCTLCESRTKVVNSHGNQQARLMFVGEAPGADEDAQGRPFVGRAGQLLNKIIEAIGLKREEVFVGNVNRCRPPQNRTPTIPEAATCKPFLLREIAIVQPEVIVVLGNTAMKNLLDAKEGITKLRGIFQDFNGIKVMPTFHPAYLLRDPSKKRETWEDMKKVREYLESNKR